MAGKRSEKWSDERLEQIKGMMLQSMSMSEIGAAMGETRNAIIGIITRNEDFFKEVPRLPKRPQRKVDKAKRQLSFQPSKPPQIVTDNPDELRTMTKLELAPEELNKAWKQISKGEKIFIYRGMAIEPTFRFSRPCAGANWRGHGVYALSKGVIFAWVNKQRIV